MLSIPTFDEYDQAVNTFQSIITSFLGNATAAGFERVVIDLRQNSGGQSLLAIDAFKQFFLNIHPYAGSRLRAHDSANVMGDTLTSYFDMLNSSYIDYNYLVANEWVATDRINADTNAEFVSWAEFLGPQAYKDDEFTTTVSPMRGEADELFMVAVQRICFC